MELVVSLEEEGSRAVFDRRASSDLTAWYSGECLQVSNQSMPLLPSVGCCIEFSIHSAGLVVAGHFGAPFRSR